MNTSVSIGPGTPDQSERGATDPMESSLRQQVINDLILDVVIKINRAQSQVVRLESRIERLRQYGTGDDLGVLEQEADTFRSCIYRSKALVAFLRGERRRINRSRPATSE